MNYYELLYNGLWDTLVEKALPVAETDKDAERAFLRLFMDGNNMFLLADKTTRLLDKEADAGNKYAQYGYARWRNVTRYGEDPEWAAYCRLQDAMDNGLPDAYAEMSQTYVYGDVDKVVWERAEELLNIAIMKGSELGLRYKLSELCYGRHFSDPQPEKALEMANELIAKYEAEGIEPCGWWYYSRACAQEKAIGYTKVMDDYKRALELGVLRSYQDLAFISSFGDGDTMRDTEEFHTYLLEGIAHRCAGAYLMDAFRLMTRYDRLREMYIDLDMLLNRISFNTLNTIHEAIFAQLSEAARLGSSTAWSVLGDMYREGSYDFKKDKEKAFSSYANGTIHDSLDCIEKMWKMMHFHDIDRPLDYIDDIALRGARNGSKHLLAEVVIAKQEGRLKKYAEEIEKYYEPIFDSPDFKLDENWNTIAEDYDDDDDDDFEEDDGRYDAWA